jgi:uncharacterized linocin/CFP29 family protein
MNDRNDQVGWTEAQWNRVREEILQAWQRVRVAGSFLPIYGPLPAGTQIVPSEILKADGSVDDQATADLLEIALPVTLSRQQTREEDLSSALLQFRRRAAQVGQLEDWYVFNGTYPSGGFGPAARAAAAGSLAGLPPTTYRPDFAFLNDDRLPAAFAYLNGQPTPIAGGPTQVEGLRRRNPGALGLIAGAARSAVRARAAAAQAAAAADPDRLVDVVVEATSALEEHGFVAPYVCVFGRDPFVEAHRSINGSTSTPRDRLEPLIGRELVHASAIDVPPSTSAGDRQSWQQRGLLLSLAEGVVDLVVAAGAAPEFRYVDQQGRYVFVVYERFALRIKDASAIVRLTFS